MVTGDILSAEIQRNTFGNISLVAMDCTKDLSAFSFVTELTTAINTPSDLHHLAQFLANAEGLKQIDIEVEASKFFDIHHLIIQNGKKIRSAYFHDMTKHNSLIMSDVRDPATAEVYLLDDSADFERLLTHVGAAPQSCGENVALTNDIFAKLEVNTRKLSHIRNIHIDVSVLDEKGVENAVLVIKGSALKVLSVCASAQDNTPSWKRPCSGS